MNVATLALKAHLISLTVLSITIYSCNPAPDAIEAPKTKEVIEEMSEDERLNFWFGLQDNETALLAIKHGVPEEVVKEIIKSEIQQTSPEFYCLITEPDTVDCDAFKSLFTSYRAYIQDMAATHNTSPEIVARLLFDWNYMQRTYDD